MQLSDNVAELVLMMFWRRCRLEVKTDGKLSFEKKI